MKTNDFDKLRKLIRKETQNNSHSFEKSSEIIEKKIFNLSRTKLKHLISDIGVIPEDIEHDSTEEKLFSKATDIVLAKTFQELGLSSSVNKERANCADVVAKSSIHGYSLIGDAKAFRLSRTAKNQKDFKIKSMADWRGDHDYAVLVCPYYQYPKNNSQIYGQALDNNICLLGWEHLLLFLEQSTLETKKLNLSSVWNVSDILSNSVTIKNKDKNTNFHYTGNKIICDNLKIKSSKLDKVLNKCRTLIVKRGNLEITFWKNQIKKIKKYSKEKAITKLLSALKLDKKISVIEKYINSLRRKK